MSTSSDARMLVLHGLRLKGFAEPAVVAETVGVPVAHTAALLDELADQGLTTYRQGSLSGHALTPAGRRHLGDLLAAELDGAGARPAVRAAYDRFVALNPELLAVCTDWQLRTIDGEPVLNDHLDRAHDAGVIERLDALHAATRPICDDLASLLDRYSPYGPRLDHALDRVRSGDHDWFTKPMIPSYHTVWFELHEDLLATLGLERSAEVPA